MKKSEQINFRVDDDLKEDFKRVHDAEGKGRDTSETIRELMRAAIRYYDKHGNLYPPWDLARADIGGGVTQSTVVAPVINGHGNHVRTHVRARRKG